MDYKKFKKFELAKKMEDIVDYITFSEYNHDCNALNEHEKLTTQKYLRMMMEELTGELMY